MENTMKTRDEILDRYTMEVNKVRKEKTFAINAYTLGWVLGFTQAETKHDLENGI